MLMYLCRGTLEDGFSTFNVDAGKCIVIVKNVPSYVCDQCGAASYNNETAKRLEEIVHSVTEPVSTEIAVISYTERAA